MYSLGYKYKQLSLVFRSRNVRIKSLYKWNSNYSQCNYIVESKDNNNEWHKEQYEHDNNYNKINISTITTIDTANTGTDSPIFSNNVNALILIEVTLLI